MIDTDQAAKNRRAKTRAANDRPSQRRSGEHPDAPVRTLTRAPMNLRDKAGDAGGGLTFDGYASVTDRGYDMWDWAGPYTEKIVKGAFDKSLAREDLDVPFVLAHDSLRRIARTATPDAPLELSADDTGLHVLAPNLDPTDADVAYIAPKIRAGLIDEMSFRFRIIGGEWSSDWTEYHIEEVDIHRGDVAIVGYGANPYTSGQLRSVVDKIAAGDGLLEGDVSAIRQALDYAAQIDRASADMRSALDSYVAGHPGGGVVVDHAAATLEVLRGRETEIRAEHARRGVAPRMTLLDVLS
jgi:HK97 family phage prohead protease